MQLTKVLKIHSMILINYLMNGRTNDMKKALYIMGASLIIGSAAAIYLLNKEERI